jgi:DNA polymerase III subunit delta'
MAGEHPDVTEVRRAGSAINVDQANDIIHIASLTPTEGDRKVLILHEFHLLTADAAAKLLKVVEEPPASTTFVVIADQIPPELTTIASRCMRVPFRALGAAEIEAALVAGGADPARAALAAASSGGSYQRATLLLGDEGVAARREAFACGAAPPRWHRPHRRGGGGGAARPHRRSRSTPAATPTDGGCRAGGPGGRARRARQRAQGHGGTPQTRTPPSPHRRAPDRPRVTAAVYRDVLVSQGDARRPEAYVAAVERIHRSLSGLGRNANEALLLQSLCLELPSL